VEILQLKLNICIKLVNISEYVWKPCPIDPLKQMVQFGCKNKIKFVKIRFALKYFNLLNKIGVRYGAVG